MLQISGTIALFASSLSQLFSPASRMGIGSAGEGLRYLGIGGGRGGFANNKNRIIPRYTGIIFTFFAPTRAYRIAGHYVNCVRRYFWPGAACISITKIYTLLFGRVSLPPSSLSPPSNRFECSISSVGARKKRRRIAENGEDASYSSRFCIGIKISARNVAEPLLT